MSFLQKLQKPKGEIQLQFYFPLLNEVKHNLELSLRIEQSDMFPVRVGYKILVVKYSIEG